MAGSEWTFKTARELSKALLAKKVSSVELTQAAIAQIEKHDGKVNAMCVRDFSRALDAARAADDAIAKRAYRPLIGIPTTIKESLTSPACRRPGASCHKRISFRAKTLFLSHG